MTTQILGREAVQTLRGEDPAYRLREVDQVAPAGMWQIDAQGADLLFQAASSADWSSFTTVVTMTSAPGITIHGTITFSGTVVFEADIRLDDDVVVVFGDDSDFYMGYSATDDELQIGTGSTIASNVAIALAGDGSILSLAVGTALVIGHTAAIATSSTNKLQLLGDISNHGESRMTIARFSADVNGPQIQFVKSRNGTVGSAGLVEDDDTIATFEFFPSGSAAFTTQSAQLNVRVDDPSPANGDVGMELLWRAQPGDGGGVSRDVFRIAADGDVEVMVGSLDLNNQGSILNVGASGNTFGAAQLDLAASFDILGANQLDINTTAGTLVLKSVGSTALTLNGTASGITSGDGIIVGCPDVVLSDSANAHYSVLKINGPGNNMTLAGQTPVTGIWGFVHISDSNFQIAQTGGAVRVDKTALLFLEGAVSPDSYVTIVHGSSLRIANARTKSGVLTNQSGIFVEALTRAAVSNSQLSLETGSTPTVEVADLVQLAAVDIAGGDARLLIVGESASSPIYIGKNTIRIALPAASAATNISLNADDELQQDTSARRWKQNIESLSDWKGILSGLRPSAFDWREEVSNSGLKLVNRHDLGFIAEEAFDVDPRLASWGSDGEIAAVRYQLIVSPLVAGWQYHEALLSAMNERLDKIEAATGG